MKRIGTIFLIAATTALVAVAKPSHSIIAALLHGKLGSGLYARSGIDPSSIASQCQPVCTPIIQKLSACKSPLASCECTQSNVEALAVCFNCLAPLGPEYVISSGVGYMSSFLGQCAAQNIELNPVFITATPTGASTAGDPLSMFEAPTPTSGATVAVTGEAPPLMPTFAAQVPGQAQSKAGSAIGLNPFRALDRSVVVAASAMIVILGVSPF